MLKNYLVSNTLTLESNKKKNIKKKLLAQTHSYVLDVYMYINNVYIVCRAWICKNGVISYRSFANGESICLDNFMNVILTVNNILWKYTCKLTNKANHFSIKFIFSSFLFFQIIKIRKQNFKMKKSKFSKFRNVLNGNNFCFLTFQMYICSIAKKLYIFSSWRTHCLSWIWVYFLHVCDYRIYSFVVYFLFLNCCCCCCCFFH